MLGTMILTADMVKALEKGEVADFRKNINFCGEFDFSNVKLSAEQFNLVCKELIGTPVTKLNLSQQHIQNPSVMHTLTTTIPKTKISSVKLHKDNTIIMDYIGKVLESNKHGHSNIANYQPKKRQSLIELYKLELQQRKEALAAADATAKAEILKAESSVAEPLSDNHTSSVKY